VRCSRQVTQAVQIRSPESTDPRLADERTRKNLTNQVKIFELKTFSWKENIPMKEVQKNNFWSSKT
jgi:hypothetical protein